MLSLRQKQIQEYIDEERRIQNIVIEALKKSIGDTETPTDRQPDEALNTNVEKSVSRLVDILNEALRGYKLEMDNFLNLDEIRRYFQSSFNVSSTATKLSATTPSKSSRSNLITLESKVKASPLFNNHNSSFDIVKKFNDIIREYKSPAINRTDREAIKTMITSDQLLIKSCASGLEEFFYNLVNYLEDVKSDASKKKGLTFCIVRILDMLAVFVCINDMVHTNNFQLITESLLQHVKNDYKDQLPADTRKKMHDNLDTTDMISVDDIVKKKKTKLTTTAKKNLPPYGTVQSNDFIIPQDANIKKAYDLLLDDYNNDNDAFINATEFIECDKRLADANIAFIETVKELQEHKDEYDKLFEIAVKGEIADFIRDKGKYPTQTEEADIKKDVEKTTEFAKRMVDISDLENKIIQITEGIDIYKALQIFKHNLKLGFLNPVNDAHIESLADLDRLQNKMRYPTSQTKPDKILSNHYVDEPNKKQHSTTAMKQLYKFHDLQKELDDLAIYKAKREADAKKLHKPGAKTQSKEYKAIEAEIKDIDTEMTVITNTLTSLDAYLRREGLL